VSHLLHPPLLDEAGLASAIQWYAEGFSERSGIRLDLALQPDLGRLPSDVEITLFRVLQEGLTNIHRHSRAAQASVEVVIRNGSVRMQISDSGCGIPQDLLREWREMRAPLGVGMAGMLERTLATWEAVSTFSPDRMGLRSPSPFPSVNPPLNRDVRPPVKQSILRKGCLPRETPRDS